MTPTKGSGPHIPHLRAERGQASVEAVAFLPVLVAVVAGVVAVFAAGAASEAADTAAHSAAVALLQGADPEAAARDALDGWPRRATGVTVTGGRVAVTVRPPLPVPGVARLLEAKRVTTVPPVAVTDALPLPLGPARGVRGGDGQSGRPRDDGAPSGSYRPIKRPGTTEEPR